MTARNIPPPPRAGLTVDTQGRLTEPWSGWIRSTYNWMNGVNVTFTGVHGSLAKQGGAIQDVQDSLNAGITQVVPLQGAHTAGSMTFTNGILTAYTAPT